MSEFEMDGAGVSVVDGADVAAEGAFGGDYARPIDARPISLLRLAADEAGIRLARRGAPLYFDLETIPDYERLPAFNLPPLPDVPDISDITKLPDIRAMIAGTAAGVRDALRGLAPPPDWINDALEVERKGKDRKEVAKHLEEARNVRVDAMAAHQDRLKLLSTTPEYCSIACLGWAVGDDMVCSLTVGQPVGDVFGADGSDMIVTERYVLDLFWRLVSRHSPLVAFNGLYFDLPVIFARSAILKVPATKRIDTRSWGADVVDPYLLRFGSKGNTDRSRPGKLKELAPLYGIPVPVEDVDGSCVDELMRTNPAKVGEYCRSDVAILRALHQSLRGYFWQ